MLTIKTRHFVRIKAAFVWHEIKKTEGNKVRTLCGRLFRQGEVKGTEPVYDKRTSWPPRFAKWCIDCQRVHSTTKGRL